MAGTPRVRDLIGRLYALSRFKFKHMGPGATIALQDAAGGKNGRRVKI